MNGYYLLRQLTMAVLVGLLIPADMAAQTESLPSFDPATVTRQLNIQESGIKGEAGYAGMVMHRDKAGLPVVTWMAIDRGPDGAATRVFIDLNNDGILIPEESFETQAPEAKNGNIRLSIKELVVGGVKHSEVRINILKDPVVKGLYFNLRVAGNPQHMMNCGWDPGLSKVSTLATQLKEAPIFDFILAGDLVIQSREFSLPLEGLGYVMYTVLTKGSGVGAMTQVGQNVIPLEDFKVDLTYKVADDAEATWRARINKVC